MLISTIKQWFPAFLERMAEVRGKFIFMFINVRGSTLARRVRELWRIFPGIVLKVIEILHYE